jgi:hypothetical protein
LSIILCLISLGVDGVQKDSQRGEALMRQKCEEKRRESHQLAVGNLEQQLRVR